MKKKLFTLLATMSLVTGCGNITLDRAPHYVFLQGHPMQSKILLFANRTGKSYLQYNLVDKKTTYINEANGAQAVTYLPTGDLLVVYMLNNVPMVKTVKNQISSQ